MKTLMILAVVLSAVAMLSVVAVSKAYDTQVTTLPNREPFTLFLYDSPTCEYSSLVQAVDFTPNGSLSFPDRRNVTLFMQNPYDWNVSLMQVCTPDSVFVVAWTAMENLTVTLSVSAIPEILSPLQVVSVTLTVETVPNDLQTDYVLCSLRFLGWKGR